MSITTLLMANSLFLAAVLVFVVLSSMRNGHSKYTKKKVREDINKIKKQINGK